MPEQDFVKDGLLASMRALQAATPGPVATVGLCESVPERGGVLVHPEWMHGVRLPLRP